MLVENDIMARVSCDGDTAPVDSTRAIPRTDGNMTTLTIPISGMSCGGCVTGVRNALSKLPGVADLDVKVGEATVKYDPGLTSPEAIRDAISRAGYSPASA
jgi:copper chaperone CopZ